MLTNLNNFLISAHYSQEAGKGKVCDPGTFKKGIITTLIQYSFLKSLTNICPFWGPLVPLFWISVSRVAGTMVFPV